MMDETPAPRWRQRRRRVRHLPPARRYLGRLRPRPRRRRRDAAPLHGGHRRRARRARRGHAPVPVSVRRARLPSPRPARRARGHRPGRGGEGARARPGPAPRRWRQVHGRPDDLQRDGPPVRSTACAGSSSSAFPCIRRSSPGWPAPSTSSACRRRCCFSRAPATRSRISSSSPACARASAARATLHVVEGADHSFSVLKRSGRSDAQVLEELADVDHRLGETGLDCGYGYRQRHRVSRAQAPRHRRAEQQGNATRGSRRRGPLRRGRPGHRFLRGARRRDRDRRAFPRHAAYGRGPSAG